MATADTEPWVHVEGHGFMPLSSFIHHRFIAERAQAEERELLTLDAEEVAEDFDVVAYTLVSELGRAFLGLVAVACTCVMLLIGALWVRHTQNQEIASVKAEVTTLSNRVSFWVPESARGE